MKSTNNIDLDGLTASILGLFPSLSIFEQRLSLVLYRLLSEGEPVPRAKLAQFLDRPVEEVNRHLDAWPGVFSDEQQRIVGYWGLAIPQAYKGPHAITISGRKLSTWCAWDTLLLPQLLQQTAEIESKSPAGSTVHLKVTPERVENRHPAEMQMSFLLPDAAAIKKDVLNAFCHFIHFFASKEDGRSWVEQHPGTFLLSLDTAYELARRRNQARYPEILPYVNQRKG